MTTLTRSPYMVLTSDLGINQFINNCYDSAKNGFNKFLKVKSWTVNTTSTPAITKFTDTTVINFTNKGSLISTDTSVNFSNTIVPNSNTLPTTNSTDVQNDNYYYAINKMPNTTGNFYWISGNKKWIFHYSNSTINLYYNPIYRPEFITFLKTNPPEICLPIYQTYCSILTTNVTGLNSDPNVTDRNVIPLEVRNQLTTPIRTLPPATVPPNGVIADSIKVSSSSNLVVKNIQVLDYNNNDILANVPVSKKSISITGATNPFVYVYFGDLAVKDVKVMGNPDPSVDISYLQGSTVTLYNNTQQVASQVLIPN